MSANMDEAQERLRKTLYSHLTNEQMIMTALCELLLLQAGSPSMILELAARGRGETTDAKE